MLKNLTRQHAELLELASEITRLISAGRPDVAKIASTLNVFSGKLTIHLAAEDKGLYPTLLAHQDQLAKNTAQRFLTEQGSLLETFTAYRSGYRTATQIGADFSAFSHQTMNLLSALKARIDNENKELYPLIA